MGDIDRVPPAPPAVQAALAAQRADDRRRKRSDDSDERETPQDTLELHDGEEPPVEEAPDRRDPDEPGTLDIAV